MLSLVLFLLTMIVGTPAQKSGAVAGTDHGSLKIGSWTSPDVDF